MVRQQGKDILRPLARQSAERRSFSRLHGGLALKDLRIAVDVARKTGAPLNMGIAAESYYAAASQDGKGRQDWSALLNQVRQQAGL